MTIHVTIFSCFFILLLLVLCSEAQVSQLSTSQESPTVSGFSLDLIHREYSPLSPFYNPLATHFDRLKNTIQRSNSRVNRIESKTIDPSRSSDTIQSKIQFNGGEYLMKLNIGSPPVETLGIADTGSDLTWIQCKPCKKCFNHTSPLFNLRASSSYKTLKCASKLCKAFDGFTGECSRKHNKCRYRAEYGDGSFSFGHLATETLTFGKTSVKKVAFGCGHNNNGIFSNTTSGIIGLGGGPLSLISQLEEIIQGKFSYCLVPISKNVSSTISFGEKAQVSNSKVASTPLFSVPGETYYHLNLEKVIIGNRSFDLKPGKEVGWQNQPGNMLIDSGTTLTYLPRGDFYNGVVSALKDAIRMETINDPLGNFKLCYKTSTRIKVPLVAFQFKGATLRFPSSSTFVEVHDGITCFTMLSSSVNIFGNILQENFKISYNLIKKRVWFQPTDCSKK